MPLELDQIYSSLDDLTVALGPTGANQQRRAHRPARDHRRELRRPGREVPPDHRGLQQAQRDPRRQQGGAVRLRPQRSRASSAPWPTNDQTVRRFNQLAGRRVRRCSSGERERAGRVAAQPRRRRWAGVRRSSRRTARSSAATSRASTGSRRCWSSSAARSTRSSTRAPLALNNLALTYNPQAGTLDTSANLGELVNQSRADPATFLCGIVSQADSVGQALRPDQAGCLPAACRRARPGRRPAARPLRPDARRTRGGAAMNRPTSCARSSLLLAGVAAADRLRLRRLQAAAARRHRRRRRPDHRARPSSATCSTWCPKSTVKVNDVSVGKVTDIDLDGYHAVVTLELRNDTELPDNAVAEHPADQPARREVRVARAARRPAPERRAAADGDVIPLDHTGRNPEVEEVLGALSLLLNGGGVAQLKTIASELNKALEGREGSARSVLDQIRRAHDPARRQQGRHRQRDRLAQPARRSRSTTSSDTIDAALEELPSALTSLDQQRDDLVKMLQALDRPQRRRRPGDPGVQGRHHRRRCASSTRCSPSWPTPATTSSTSFNVFLTYPFVDEVVGRDPQVARNLHMGDYTNLSIELDLDLDTGVTCRRLPDRAADPLPTCRRPADDLDPTDDPRATCSRASQSGDLTSEACQKVLGDARRSCSSSRRSAPSRRTRTRRSARSSTSAGPALLAGPPAAARPSCPPACRPRPDAAAARRLRPAGSSSGSAGPTMRAADASSTTRPWSRCSSRGMVSADDHPPHPDPAARSSC